MQTNTRHTDQTPCATEQSARPEQEKRWLSVRRGRWQARNPVLRAILTWPKTLPALAGVEIGRQHLPYENETDGSVKNRRRQNQSAGFTKLVYCSCGIDMIGTRKPQVAEVVSPCHLV